MGYILPKINDAVVARVKHRTLHSLLSWIKIAFITQLREGVKSCQSYQNHSNSRVD